MNSQANSPLSLRSLILTWVLMILLCVALLLFAPPFGEGRLTFADEGMLMEQLLSDGQFVWGPNVGDFSVKTFLEARHSPLALFANDIEVAAAYTSVNPKVLLAVLEVRYGLVRSYPDGSEADGIRKFIEDTAYDLSIPFYNHLYTWGSRKNMRQTSQPKTAILSFEDEITEQLNTEISSGTFAIASALSQNLSYEIWQSAVSTKSSVGFAQVFAEFFPNTDPLSTANSINPPSLPPDNFFQLPFPLGMVSRIQVITQSQPLKESATFERPILEGCPAGMKSIMVRVGRPAITISRSWMIQAVAVL
jgi:hypothetical protein